MLKSLHLRSFVLIDNLTVDFGGGFNALTGETGAGKSVLIDAISLLLGGRGGAEFVRQGAEKATIDGVFFLSEQDAAFRILKETDDICDEGDLTLSREIYSNGRSVCKINGRPANVASLRMLGDLLVDIHGQNLNQTLMESTTQRELLDALAGEPAAALRKGIAAHFNAFRDIEVKINELGGDESSRLRMQDQLTYQVSEIEDAGLRPGEEEELLQERDRLAGSGKIAESLALALACLDDDEQGGAAITLAGRAVHQVGQVSALDSVLEDICETLQQGQENLQDALRKISNYLDDFDFSPQRLDDLEKRLFQISKLKAKYGGSVEEVILACQEAQNRLNELLHCRELIKELEAKKVQCRSEYNQLAGELREVRLRTAQKMANMVLDELKSLEMGRAQFVVDIEPGIFHETGSEVVRFLVSPNPGEIPKPIAKVASGGELARIMLAIKTILADVDAMPTLIFDEIDAGIGGRTAHAVGERLDLLGKGRQVICVTHSPQIAALADYHLCIEKSLSDTTTTIQVSTLSPEKRRQEIARMLAGKTITDTSIRQADELIQRKGT